jgi:hypothetical protein
MNKAISDRVRKSARYREIRQSLLDQLKFQGADTAAFRDLVDDYMDFWVIKQLTIIDIRTRGPVITYNNGGGQTGTKENPSIAYKIKISSQMMKILQQLNLNVDNAGTGDGCDGL